MSIVKTTKVFKKEYEKEIFITSDGKEHLTELDAENHEFYRYKLNVRYIFDNEATIADIENLDDLKRFVKDNYYSDTELLFDYKDLTFPNTYAFEEHLIPIENNGEDDVWLRESSQLQIYTLDEYKYKLITYINSFK